MPRWPNRAQDIVLGGFSTPLHAPLVPPFLRHGLTPFGYFETDDLQATVDCLRDDPINARWTDSMAPIMQIDIDPRIGYSFVLPT